MASPIIHFFDQYRLDRQHQRGELPSEISAYLDQRRLQPSPETPWEQLRFVVFDTETTGLDLRKDRLLSIGAVTVENGSILLGQSLEILVRQDRPGHNEAAHVHGLLSSELKRGEEEQAALARFLRFIGPAVLVGHHAAFDVGMIEQAVRRRVPSFRLYNRCIDTAHLAIRCDQPVLSGEPVAYEKYSLDALALRFRIRSSDRHTAWGDALITAQLLLKLLRLRGGQVKPTLRSLL